MLILNKKISLSSQFLCFIVLIFLVISTKAVPKWKNEIQTIKEENSDLEDPKSNTDLSKSKSDLIKPKVDKISTDLESHVVTYSPEEDHYQRSMKSFKNIDDWGELERGSLENEETIKRYLVEFFPDCPETEMTPFSMNTDIKIASWDGILWSSLTEPYIAYEFMVKQYELNEEYVEKTFNKHCLKCIEEKLKKAKDLKKQQQELKNKEANENDNVLLSPIEFSTENRSLSNQNPFEKSITDLPKSFLSLKLKSSMDKLKEDKSSSPMSSVARSPIISTPIDLSPKRSILERSLTLGNPKKDKKPFKSIALDLSEKKIKDEYEKKKVFITVLFSMPALIQSFKIEIEKKFILNELNKLLGIDEENSILSLQYLSISKIGLQGFMILVNCKKNLKIRKNSH